MKKNIKHFIYVNIGIILMAFSFSFFLEKNNIVTGGVTGLSLIITKFIDIDTSFIVLILNLIILLLCLIFLGKKQFISALYGSLIYPVYIYLIDLIIKNVNLELDMFLTIIFSSFILGLGLGLVLKYNYNTGGTDILQQILHKYFHIPYSVSLYFLDGSVVLIGGLVYNISTALYAIIFVFISGYVMDAVIYGGFNKRACFIISDKKDEIKNFVINEIVRGVTEVYIKGGYLNNDKKMLIIVLNTNEYIKLIKEIDKIDKNAFLFVTKTSEVRGLGFSIEDNEKRI